MLQTEHCPYVLDRILKLTSHHGVIPLTLSIAHDFAIRNIEIEIEAMPVSTEAQLLQDLRRINMIRGVRLESAISYRKRNAEAAAATRGSFPRRHGLA